MKKLLLLASALVTAAVALSATAAAGTPPTSTEMLKFFTGGAGTIAWTSAGGSSTAADNQALMLTGTTMGSDWSGAYAVNATSAGDLLSDFNASFDVKGYQGAGSPRISLPVDTDGNGTTDMWAYLSAFYASGDPVGTTGFETVDFQDSSSTIYTSSSTILNGLSDPLNATGSIDYQYGHIDFSVNDADVRAGWRVATDYQPFLILDEAPAVSYVDDLTIGSYNWTRPGANGFLNNVADADNAAEDGGALNWSSPVYGNFDVTVEHVTISGDVVALSGHMINGTGQWADPPYVNAVIQYYIDTAADELYGLIGGPNVPPASSAGLQGPFPFTGPVTIS